MMKYYTMSYFDVMRLPIFVFHSLYTDISKLEKMFSGQGDGPKAKPAKDVLKDPAMTRR